MRTRGLPTGFSSLQNCISQRASSKAAAGCCFAHSPRVGIAFQHERDEVIEQFKALPASERAQVAKFVMENDDSWIPESFKQGMADAERGRLVDLDTALTEPYPGD